MGFFVSLKKKKKKRQRNLESKIIIIIIMGEKGKKRTQDEMEKGEEDAVEIMPGTIKSVRLQNFMCHEHLLVDLGPRINFITGENGSGKSAVLTALTLALGTSARKTNRTSKDGVKGLIRTGQHSAKIRVEPRVRHSTPHGGLYGHWRLRGARSERHGNFGTPQSVSA